MHKQVVIIGAGPAGLLLARLLFDAGIDCIILENRNEPFLKKLNRGGFLERRIVQVLKNFSAGLSSDGIPINQVDFHFENNKVNFPINNDSEQGTAIIYDQKLIISDLLEGLKADGQEIIFEAKAQRYEGLEKDKARIVYTLDGQLYDMTCDYVIGCDGFRGISRRSIPREVREETKEELPYAWLEWMVAGTPTHRCPIIAYQEDGFAMQTINAANQTRYYLQLERGIEMDDLPTENDIWDMVERRLAIPVERGELFNKKLDYMRSFSTRAMQHGRLFITGDAAHQVPRLGSKGINMAFGDAIRLAKGVIEFYKNNHSKYLESYTQNSLEVNLKTIEYTNYLNQLFHKNAALDYQAQVAAIQQLLTKEQEKKQLQNYLVG